MNRLSVLNMALAGLLVIQGAVYLVMPERNTEFRSVYEPVYKGMTGENVWKIEIYSPQDKQKVVLAKKDKGWVLPEAYDYPADVSKVDEILSLIQTFRRAKVVGHNKAMYPSYGVTDDKPHLRLRMMDKDGKVLVDLLVGKGMIRSTFVRKAGGDRVYEVATSLSAKLFTDASFYYKDSRLKMPVPKARKRITLEYNGQKLVFEKKTTKDSKGKEHDEWSLVSPTALEGLKTAEGTPTQPEFDRSRIDMFVTSLNNINFSDIAGKVGSGDFGFDRPYITLTVETEKGEKHVIKVGNKVPKKKDSTAKEGSLVRSDRYAVLDDGPYVVVLKSYIYGDWEKKFQDFLKKPKKDTKDGGKKIGSGSLPQDDSEATASPAGAKVKAKAVPTMKVPAAVSNPSASKAKKVHPSGK